MSSRAMLGAADVSDEQLSGMVAALFGDEVLQVSEVAVDRVDYDQPAITTAGRWWVSGAAATASGARPFRIFVKHVQAWERHPYFQFVPPEAQPFAAAGVPWRTEPLVYRSDLASRLPAGLSMPRALGVFDLDNLSASIWLEEVPTRGAVWDCERHRRAAYLLGRMSGSAQVQPLARIGWQEREFGITGYVRGRLTFQVVPLLTGDDAWRHPLCAAFDDELRDRMRAVLARVPELAAEAETLPKLAAHGDACPNNLLAGPDDDFVLLDFGFWGDLPVGFDLGQLLVGDVQIGRRGAATLADLDDVIVPAYVAGLRAEGLEIEEPMVRRAHALQLLIMTGLSALPIELFDAPVTDRTLRLAADRALLARYCLDQLDRTEP